MPTVVVDRVATGIQMTREGLQRTLVGIKRVVVRDAAGKPRHLGGGEAAIWRAGSSGEYVLKVFRDVAEDRAEPEFEKLQVLQSSSYIPRVYGFGRLVESDGVEHPAIIEECVHGVSLAEVVASGKLTGDARNKCLDAMETATIALGLTRGVRELKKVGLAHRDISCGNVLLSKDCVDNHLVNGAVVRLVDFGTATDVARSDATVLQSGVRLATIPFGAPEMFGGDYYEAQSLADDLVLPGRNSGSTDVWSIGAIIVFLMWGEYWPQEIEDIHRRQLSGLLRVDATELSRIVQAKKQPIGLMDLIQRSRAIAHGDAEMAEIVRDCTRYEPILRPTLDQIEFKLLKVIELFRGKAGSIRIPLVTPILNGDSQAASQGGRTSTRLENQRDAVNAPQIYDKTLPAIVTDSPAQKVTPSPRHVVSSVRQGQNISTVKTTAANQRRQLLSVPSVDVRGGIADYSWIDLKLIARAIAAAGSDSEGLRIAKKYHLVDEDGKLRGDTKPLILADGTKTGIRILGFRHDERAAGGGRKSGVTFEFANVLARHVMNSQFTNEGGWEACDMRAWLNAGFLKMLPGDIRPLVEPVRKMTNNKGKVKNENDTTGVTPTVDKLWLLSVSEIYGNILPQRKNKPWSPATYDAEGTQYQFYDDKETSLTSFESCKKSGASSWWWLRSPHADRSGGFRLVLSDGDWDYWNYARDDGGVSPGFCF